MSKIYGGDDKYDSTIKRLFFFSNSFYNRDDNFSLLLAVQSPQDNIQTLHSTDVLEKKTFGEIVRNGLTVGSQNKLWKKL